MWINNFSGEGVLELAWDDPGYRQLAQTKMGVSRYPMWETQPSRGIHLGQINAEGVLAMHHKDRAVLIAVTFVMVLISVLITQGYRLGVSRAGSSAKVSQAEALPAPQLAAEMARQQSIRSLQSARESFFKKNIAGAGQELRQAAGYFRQQSDQAADTTRQDLLTTAANLERIASDLERGLAVSGGALDQVLETAFVALARQSSQPSEASAGDKTASPKLTESGKR